MNKKMKSLVLLGSVVAITLSLSLGALAKNENSNKSAQAKEKKMINLNNFEKADKQNGKTNANIHREKIGIVVKNLGEVVKKEETVGNVKASNQIGQVVKAQEMVREQNAGAIEQVENRNKFKNFLLGTDYKNLGQLRSNLVQNRNQIRELTRTLAQVQNEADKIMIQEQLQTLMQERERIKSVIQANGEGFSLLGWVSRFLTNYEETPINDQEEEDLNKEVKEAIETSQI